jgi:hypothetical protein
MQTLNRSPDRDVKDPFRAMTQPTPRWARVVGFIVVVFTALVGLSLIVGPVLIWSGRLPDYVGPDGKSLATTDLASAAVAGATMLLAAVTGTLALFTWEGLATAQREVLNTERALNAAQDQVEQSRRQVDATNEQARIAQETLVAGWRPLLVEVPVGAGLGEQAERYARVMIQVAFGQEFRFEVGFANFGRGPAFVTSAELLMDAIGSRSANGFQPTIVPERAIMVVSFVLDPQFLGGPDRAMAEDLKRGLRFLVTVSYQELARQRTWRSTQLFEAAAPGEWKPSGVMVAEVMPDLPRPVLPVPG